MSCSTAFSADSSSMNMSVTSTSLVSPAPSSESLNPNSLRSIFSVPASSSFGCSGSGCPSSNVRFMSIVSLSAMPSVLSVIVISEPSAAVPSSSALSCGCASSSSSDSSVNPNSSREISSIESELPSGAAGSPGSSVMSRVFVRAASSSVEREESSGSSSPASGEFCCVVPKSMSKSGDSAVSCVCSSPESAERGGFFTQTP